MTTDINEPDEGQQPEQQPDTPEEEQVGGPTVPEEDAQPGDPGMPAPTATPGGVGGHEVVEPEDEDEEPEGDDE